MPELPEVEVVRGGLERWVVGRTVGSVEVSGDRTVRRHDAGPTDFVGRIAGRTILAAQRRGKFLWLPLGAAGQCSAESDEALVAHLGMSGQLVLPPNEAPAEAHLRARITFADDGRTLRFVDQRTFGWLAVESLVRGAGDRLVPTSVAAIAADPMEESFDVATVGRALRRRRQPVKAALLDQQLVSGIGNIYADEALWRVRRNWATQTDRMRQSDAVALLGAATEVMTEALAAGGTSFDSLYVNVNGSSGYFARSLRAYGREGQPCDRCGAPILREQFGNRSSFRCPRCQRRPRRV
ncbi:MAG: hypothetical protein RLZ55_1367 [Actinomycetota bacterium]|jgi:formamidopyrimidine-DNA glycosylase